MKKLALVVFAVITVSAPDVRGEVFNLDFDGRVLSAGNYTEIIDSVEVPEDIACAPAPPFESAPPDAGPLSGGIEAPHPVLDWSIRTAIEYAGQNNSPSIKRGLFRLLKEGTLEEKKEFVRGDKTVYSLPERFTPVFKAESGIPFRRSVTNNNKIQEQMCVRTRMEKQCGYQLVCELVCGAAIVGGGAIVGGTTGATVGSVVAGPACSRVCKDVEECRMVEVCDEWVPVPVNIGQDSNGHWS